MKPKIKGKTLSVPEPFPHKYVFRLQVQTRRHPEDGNNFGIRDTRGNWIKVHYLGTLYVYGYCYADVERMVPPEVIVSITALGPVYELVQE